MNVNRGRFGHHFPQLLRDPHPLCVLHRRGLDEIVRVVAWVHGRPRPDTLRLVAEVARHPDLLQIIQGLRAGGFESDFAAHQIVNDCQRVGVHVRDHARDVARIVQAVYSYLDELDRHV